MLYVSYISIKLKEKEETAVEPRKSLRKERLKEYSSNQIMKLSTSKKKKYRITGTSLESVKGHISMPFLKIIIQAEHQNENKVYQFSSVQSLSHVRLFGTPWTTACQASLFITNSWSLLKLKSYESVMLSNHLMLCHPLLLLPSVFPSIRLFSNESVLHMRWPKYWSFSYSISPSNEYSGLISFRMDWLDLLDVQETLRSLRQHHTSNSSKASVLRCSAFFIVQLSLPYMTTGKTKALTRWTFVDKVMSLLFNMISRLVITLLPRSKCLLISWLQSSSAVILESKIIKSVTVSTVSPSICHEVMGPDVMKYTRENANFKTANLLHFVLTSLGFQDTIFPDRVFSTSH